MNASKIFNLITVKTQKNATESQEIFKVVIP